MACQVYLVRYDIVDDGRRNQVYKYLRGWGDPLQFSVFRVLVGRTDLEKLKVGLRDKIKPSEDQVLLFDLGPEEGRGRQCVEAIGLAYTHPERHAVIV